MAKDKSEHHRSRWRSPWINEAIRQIKRDYWEKFSAYMEHDLYGAHKKVWNMLRNRKKQTDINNYRGISIFSAVQKLMRNIPAKEIEQTGLSEEEQSFQQNKFTVDAIFILRQIAEKAIEISKPIFICFVDLQQAFDKVKLGDVQQLLRARGVNENIMHIIK
ncbi:PREDICTED: uncharacterized protein LOC107073587 [Polistes dominula]|uniref:Uncharacterized protein LOC107073587 n=1 Tax=Polistes dominula TaxID=743375 RepID=A0ABM1JBC7_POLDO|nr:PREDICTED: uncharacterized protein LOC107073587 [Polistes dominula]